MSWRANIETTIANNEVNNAMALIGVVGKANVVTGIADTEVKLLWNDGSLLVPTRKRV